MIKCEKCNKECASEFGLKVHLRSCKKEVAASGVILATESIVQKIEEPVVPEVNQYNTEKWKELPRPIQEHLKLTFGSWLNYFEVGQEWKQDFGGYGMYIKVPKEFSVEWRTVDSPKYDNLTQKLVENNKMEIPDIRWKPLANMADATRWIDLVKHRLIEDGFRKGIRMPSTNTPVDESMKTIDEYKKSIAG